MLQDTNNMPTLKEIEEALFRQLQNYFQTVMLKVLEDIDVWLMENRDHKRFAYKERQASTMDTMFGSITIKRRKYVDRETNERVALLDRYLQFKGNESMSPFLAQQAVEWAVRGPSYRDARDRLKQLLGYQAMSHEQIRQKVLQIQAEACSRDHTSPKEVDVLFIEADGLNASLQQSDKGSHEVKMGVVHEGWEKRHPKSKDYELVNKTYIHTLEDGDTLWETLSRQLEEQYTITEHTHVVINGDGAPWIRAGVDYFQNALYTYDRYHLKTWIKQALSNRSKQERQRVYEAADAHDPSAMLAAIAEAEKAETDVEKQAEIAGLREFILENQEAFRDYRERLKEKGVDTSGMRPMGSAESNMNLMSKRLKKNGYSWSRSGLGAMVSAMIHRFEGTLVDVLRPFATDRVSEEETPKGMPSMAHFLKQKTQESIGARSGHLPALEGREQTKPFARALRGLTGLSGL
ncbi:MAG: ISLre2 family transposase [Novibacillus thermophilus]